jgi:hypothetical protein
MLCRHALSTCVCRFLCVPPFPHWGLQEMTTRAQAAGVTIDYQPGCVNQRCVSCLVGAPIVLLSMRTRARG